MSSFATRMVRELASIIRPHGAEMGIIAIHPEVAVALVRLGLKPWGAIMLDFEEGISYLNGRAHAPQWEKSPIGQI